MTNETMIETQPLRLGDVAPDFKAESTQGEIRFHEWAGASWVLFFSHPKDFTPVCTTELGQAARMKAEWAKRGVKVLVVSVDGIEEHKKWILDIEQTQETKVDFPLLGGPGARDVARLYGMIHPKVSETFTVRSVFFIDPAKKIRAMITYPAATGRNFDEILRVIDALQLTDRSKVATPANWNQGGDCIVLPSVSDEDAKKLFPKGFKAVKPYLRITPQPGN